MDFFTPHRSGRVGAVVQADPVDRIILEIGRSADEAILNMIAESRASQHYVHQLVAEMQAESAAWRIMEARRREKQYPGYQEVLNRQRAALGLPPI